MKKNKKIFLSLIMLLFTLIFTGCAFNNNNNNNDTNNNNSSDNTQDVPETPIYIHKGEYKNSPWGFTPISMSTKEWFLGINYDVKYRVIIYNNSPEQKTLYANTFTIGLKNYGDTVYYEKAKINDNDSVTINGHDYYTCIIKFTVGGSYLNTGTTVSFYYLTTFIGDFEDIEL